MTALGEGSVGAGAVRRVGRGMAVVGRHGMPEGAPCSGDAERDQSANRDYVVLQDACLPRRHLGQSRVLAGARRGCDVATVGGVVYSCVRDDQGSGEYEQGGGWRW